MGNLPHHNWIIALAVCTAKRGFVVSLCTTCILILSHWWTCPHSCVETCRACLIRSVTYLLTCLSMEWTPWGICLVHLPSNCERRHVWWLQTLRNLWRFALHNNSLCGIFSILMGSWWSFPISSSSFTVPYPRVVYNNEGYGRFRTLWPLGIWGTLETVPIFGWWQNP